MLALGTTLDASVIQFVRDANSLRDFYRLVERG